MILLWHTKFPVDHATIGAQINAACYLVWKELLVISMNPDVSWALLES